MEEKHIEQFEISGEVMEILEQESKCVIKMVCRPKFLLLATNLMTDLHLGDKVMIEGSYHITKIIPELE